MTQTAYALFPSPNLRPAIQAMVNGFANSDPHVSHIPLLGSRVMRMNLKSSACAAAAATAALCLSSVTDFDPFHTDLLSAHAGGAPAFAGKGKGKDGKDVADDAKDKGKGKRKDKGEDKDEVAGNDDDFIGNDNGGNDAMGSSDDADIASTDAAQPDVTRDSDQWERVRRRQTPTQTDGDI